MEEEIVAPGGGGGRGRPLKKRTQAKPDAWRERPDDFDPARAYADRELAERPKNDSGNAERLRARHGADLLYTDQRGWGAWDGGRWDFENGDPEALKRAQATAAAIYGEAEALKAEAPDPGADPHGHEAFLAERVDKLYGHAVQSGNAGKCSAMLEMAAPHLRAAMDDLDSHEHLFNVEGATLALGEAGPDGAAVTARPPARTDRITKQARAPWSPAGSRADVEAFLRRILPDTEKAAFLQRWIGHALHGSLKEAALLVMTGKGSNGKTMFVRGLSGAFGDYAVQTPIETFTSEQQRSPAAPTPDLARMQGARFVFAVEPRRNAVLDEGIMKRLTGGDRQPARYLQREFFEYTAQFHPILVCNKKPEVRDPSYAMWRRIHVLAFGETLGERDRPLVARAIAPEARAQWIAWAADGWCAYAERGLDPPSSVLDEVAKYRSDSDSVGKFLEQGCIRGEDLDEQAALLYGGYCVWAMEGNEPELTQTAFGRRMMELGHERTKIGVRRYFGLRLHDDLREKARLHLENVGKKLGAML